MVIAISINGKLVRVEIAVKLTPKTPELLVEMPLAAPDWKDVLHVESQQVAHRGFVKHIPVLHSEGSKHPAHQR